MENAVVTDTSTGIGFATGLVVLAVGGRRTSL